MSITKTRSEKPDGNRTAITCTWPFRATRKITDSMSLRDVLVIFGAGLILTLPCILYGFPKFAHDGATHAIWYGHFIEQLSAGDLYPRWLQDMNGGLGSPVFFYYGPAPYYLASLIHPFFAKDPHALYQLGVSASIALIMSGLCIYVWLNKVTDQRSALMAAILYMVMPYHVAVDLYSRGALAEFWAFVWLPLILYFVCMINSRPMLATIGLALSYALLIMTHLPTTLIFSIIPILYALSIAEKHQRAKVVSITVWAMILGIGLSAIYLLPAMMTQEFVSVQEMKGNFFYYEIHFLFATLNLDRFTAKLSCMVSIMVSLAICAYRFARRSPNINIRRESIFWLVVVMLSFYMMTPLSKPMWQIISTLQMLQFTYRLSIILTVATAALFALGSFTITHSYTESTSGMLTMVIGFLLVLMCVCYTTHTAWSGLPFTDHSQRDEDEVNQKMRISKSPPEYRPRWAGSLDINSLESLLQKIGKDGENPVRVNIMNGTGEVIVRRWKPRDIVLQVDSPNGVLLTVSQLYYPCWTARMIDESKYLTIEPSKPDGLLSIPVPGGHHHISLHLDRSVPEHIGQIVSSFSAMMVVASACFGAARRSFTPRFHIITLTDRIAPN